MRVGHIEAAATARAGWRECIVIGGALEGIAVALWLAPASIHIVNWPATGPQRLALLAPAMRLVWLTLGAAAVMVAVMARSRRDALSGSASRVAPFWLLWLWVVPYLPWAPDRLPLLLVLSGPLQWVVAAGAILGAAIRVSNTRARLVAPLALGRRAIFLISLGAYLTIGIHSVRTIGLRGDEPHYLIITESLLRDADLQIENNHRRGDYRSFVRSGDLPPDYLVRGKNGEIYSIHAPGLSALLLPAYAAAGHIGAVVFLCLAAALTSLAIFDLALAIGGQEAAVFTWMSVCLTIPFVPYSWMIFPEMFGALIVAGSALWLWRPPAGRLRTWLLRGTALALLPWLHTKFVILLAVFGVALAVRVWRQPKAVAALLVPIAGSSVAWFYSFYAIYGVFDPQRPYGATARTYLRWSNIPHGLLGLFFDPKFGLLAYSPIYLTALVGAWMMLRRPRMRFLAIVLIAAVAAFVGSTARFYMFWGGWSAPARFLVPILPCLAAMMALAMARARRAASRGLIGLWLVISIGMACVGLASPADLMLFSDPHGRARVFEAIQGGSPLALLLPAFTDPDWASQVNQLGAWLAAAAIGLTTVLVASRTRAFKSGWSVAGVGSLAFLLTRAGVAGAPAEDVRNDAVRRSAIDILWRYDGTRLRTLDYATWTHASPDTMLRVTTVDAPSPTRGWINGEYRILGGSLELPPGEYAAEVWFDVSRPRDAEAMVALAPGAVFGRAAGMFGNPTTIPFDLPAAIHPLALRVPNPAVAKAITSVRIVPKVVLPPSIRQSPPARSVDSISGADGAYIIYADESAFPEGGVFWTRGHEKTRVVVAPNGASKMVLTLSTGPMTGEVEMSADGHSQRIPMKGGETIEVPIAIAPGQRHVPLSIRSSVAFYPADFDEGSRDMRSLGCQVRITLH